LRSFASVNPLYFQFLFNPTMVESHCALQKIVLLEHEKCGKAATLLATSLYHKLWHKQNAQAVSMG
jgi:hypothetical protein